MMSPYEYSISMSTKVLGGVAYTGTRMSKREIVFVVSLRRLDLQLICDAMLQNRLEKLNIWPPLPVVIRQYDLFTWGVDNIIAARSSRT